MAVRDIAIRYVVDVVDRGTRQLLADDRRVRTSAQQTGRALQEQAAKARAASASIQSSSRGQVVSAQQVARSQLQVDRNAKIAERSQARSTARARESAAAFGRSARAAAGFAGAFGLAGAGRTAIDFERQLRNVNSIAGLSERQLKRLQRSVIDLGGRTAQSPRDLARGLYDIYSSGFQGADALKILKAASVAATAGLTDTATSTKVVAAVLNAYHKRASDAKDVSDVLFQTVKVGVINFEELAQSLGDSLPFASQLGVNLKQLGGAISTLTLEGLGPEETMTRIRNVLVSLIKPTEGMQKAFRQLGVESGAQLIKTKGFQGALDALFRTTGGNREQIAKLFPNIRSLGGFLALTGKNAQLAHRSLREVADSSGATSRAFQEQSKSFAVQWDKFKATMEGVAITVGARVLPVMTKLLQGAIAFGRQHGTIVKLAGAFVGVAAAVKAIRFTSALLGVTDLAKGAARAAAAFRALAAGEGLAAAAGAARGRTAPTVVAGPQAPVGGVAAVAGRAGRTGRLATAGTVAGSAALIGGSVAAGQIRGPAGNIAQGALAGAGVGLIAGPEGAAIGAGAGALLAGAFTKSIRDKVIDWFRSNWQKALITAVTAVTLGPVGLVVGGLFIGSIRSAIARGARGLAGAVANVARGLVQPFVGIGSRIGRTVAAGFNAIRGPLTTGLKVLLLPWTLYVSVLYRIWRGLFQGLSAVVRPALRPIGTALSTLANVITAPIRRAVATAGRVLGTLDNVGGRAVRTAVRVVSRAWTIVAALTAPARRAVGSVVGALGSLAGRAGRPVGHAADVMAGKLRDFVGRAGHVAGQIVDAIASPFGDLGKKIIDKIGDLAGAIRNKLKDIVPGPLKDLVPWHGREGGVARRYQSGGVAALVSPGELLIDPLGQRSVVPGSRVAADSVFAVVPDKTRVFTDSGRGMLTRGTLDDVIAAQAPHFQAGGVAGAAAASRSALAAGLRDQRHRTLMVAVSGRESRWNPRATNHNTNGTTDWGPWQINDVHKSWAGRLWGDRMSWAGGARLMYQVLTKHGGLGAWRLHGWGGDSTTAPFMETARSGVKRSGGATATATRVNRSLQGRLPSKTAAFASGFQAGLEGSPLWDEDILPDIISAASVRTSRTNVRSSRGTSPGGSASGHPRVQQIVRAANSISDRYPYVYGGGHSQPASVTGGADCSSSVAYVLQHAGFKNFSTGTSGQYESRGVPGKGRFLTVLANAGHTYMVINGRAFGTSQSNPRGGPGWISGYTYRSGFAQRRPRDLDAGVFRRGGRVGRFQSGGRITDTLPTRSSIRADLGGRVTSILHLPASANNQFKNLLHAWANRITELDDISKSFVKDHIGQLTDMLHRVRQQIRRIRRGGVTRQEQPRLRRLQREIDNTPDQIRELRSSLTPEYTYRQLERFENRLGGRIRRLQRGPEGFTQRAQIRRLQAFQRVVQTELGRRLGLAVGRIDARLTGLDTQQTRFDQAEQARGVDAGSIQGLKENVFFGTARKAALTKLQSQLRKALQTARRRHDRNAVTEIQTRLDNVAGLIGDTATTLAENQRTLEQEMSDPKAINDMQQALAALTPDTADDKAAAQARVGLQEQILKFVQAAYAGGQATPADVAQAAQDLKGAKDALDALTGAVDGGSDLVQAVKDLTAETKRVADQAETIEHLSLREAQRALADIISGQIFGQANQRSRAAGDGVVGARY